MSWRLQGLLISDSALDAFWDIFARGNAALLFFFANIMKLFYSLYIFHEVDSNFHDLAKWCRSAFCFMVSIFVPKAYIHEGVIVVCNRNHISCCNFEWLR